MFKLTELIDRAMLYVTCSRAMAALACCLHTSKEGGDSEMGGGVSAKVSVQIGLSFKSSREPQGAADTALRLI